MRVFRDFCNFHRIYLAILFDIQQVKGVTKSCVLFFLWLAGRRFKFHCLGSYRVVSGKYFLIFLSQLDMWLLIFDRINAKQMIGKNYSSIVLQHVKVQVYEVRVLHWLFIFKGVVNTVDLQDDSVRML